MAVNNSPNMNLPIPVVGSEPGPQYATDVNSSLSLVDGHDHSSGSGVQITPAGINISADLPFNTNNATLLRSTRYASQVTPISGSADLNCLSVSGVDLYYRDGSGNIVRITQSGGVAGSPGSIANLTSPASASYVALNGTFVWEQDASTAANMDFASAILRNTSAGSFGLTLSPPTLASDYTLTLPSIPMTTAFLTVDNTGNIGSSIPISQGITDTMLADNSVTTRTIVSQNVTTAKIADNAVTPIKLSAANYGNSGTSGIFLTSSTSPVDVQTASLTASGLRPVLVVVGPASNGAASFMQITDNTNPPVGLVFITRTATILTQQQLQTNNAGQTIVVPYGASIIDFPTAGTYTYKIQAKVVSATSILELSHVNIIAYEL